MQSTHRQLLQIRLKISIENKIWWQITLSVVEYHLPFNKTQVLTPQCT